MKERPILFSGPMVRAILEGRKTQTRRVVKPQPLNNRVGMVNGAYARLPNAWLVNGSVSEYHDKGITPPRWECPYGLPGDRLWVRETWAEGWTYGGGNRVVIYRATNDGYIGSETYPVLDVQNGKYGLTARGADASAPENLKWRPSIHMPRWASRITLGITAVRVERLRDISLDDGVAEGFEDKWTCLNPGTGSYAVEEYAVDAFERLWQSINSKRPGCSWADNPWVWVIEFQRVEA